MHQFQFKRVCLYATSMNLTHFRHIRHGFSESGVPPNSVIFGGIVPLNSVLFGGIVSPNNELFGGTVLFQNFFC